MTIEKMRAKVMEVYPNWKWRDRVEHMPDDQVVAVYYKFKEDGKIKVKKGKKIIFHQMTIDEWLKDKESI